MEVFVQSPDGTVSLQFDNWEDLIRRQRRDARRSTTAVFVIKS